MAIANFPTSLVPIIQQGWLEHAFQQPLRSRLGYRAVAEREQFVANVGETITKTRTGLLAANTTPLSATAVDPLGDTAQGLDNGLTPVTYGVEQYTVSLNNYGVTMNLNTVTQRVGIEDRFVQNARVLGENAHRSMDVMCRDALFAGYMSGNTSVTTTLGAAGATIAVDDVRGFQTTAVNGKQTAIGGGVTMAVTVNGTEYTLSGVTVDGSNTSKAYGGKSGTLTMSANVTIADGTAGNAVIAGTAPTITRPNGRTTYGALQSGDVLTMSALLDAKAALDMNAVPDINGFFHVYLDPVSARQLFADSDFRQLFQGATSENEVFKLGAVESPFLGLRFIRTTNAPVQAHPTIANAYVRRPIICGAGALIEADFADQEPDGALDEAVRTVEDGVTMITRPPLDRFQQIIAQSWYWIGGFVAPTDLTTNPNTVATATNAQYKRAVAIEHIG